MYNDIYSRFNAKQYKNLNQMVTYYNKLFPQAPIKLVEDWATFIAAEKLEKSRAYYRNKSAEEKKAISKRNAINVMSKYIPAAMRNKPADINVE